MIALAKRRNGTRLATIALRVQEKRARKREYARAYRVHTHLRLGSVSIRLNIHLRDKNNLLLKTEGRIV